MSVSEQMHTYSTPYQTLTLTCYQLTIVGLGEGRAVDWILTLIHHL